MDLFHYDEKWRSYGWLSSEMNSKGKRFLFHLEPPSRQMVLSNNLKDGMILLTI